ncbi:hypothetical protein [Rhodanobacter denitrificans]|uniref:hypothetical protein n=1 Tax=Rhodanobacter denitrificans TaxID=666685 RepID=UPI001F2AB44C|nr:hypothetical protein [Rhodanobacter denitrificans]UJJ57201.1 hypothetical protein LRK55_10990 [Rhodanobacter denitrificans]
MIGIQKFVALNVTAIILSACALDPYAPSTMPQEDLSFDSYIATQSGCKVRWPVKHKAAITSLTWTGGCDANGYASGPGTLTQTFSVGGSPGSAQTVATMANGLQNGPISSISTFTSRGVVYRTESTGYAEAGKPVGESTIIDYENGHLESTYSVTNAGGNVTVQKTGSGAPRRPVQSADADQADESDDSTADSNAGLQVFGAILNTAIQARGMKDVASSQRTYQAAANQQARASTAALALAQQQTTLQAQQAAQTRQNSSYSQSASQQFHSQEATQCISLQGSDAQSSKLVNVCNEYVSVVWCSEGDYDNCNRGLSSEAKLAPGNSTPVEPLGTRGKQVSVHWIACTDSPEAGSLTAVAYGMQARCR